MLTDHYFPRAEGDFPTLLVRSPYGRGLPWSPLYGVLFAEQGFHVVLQSCRGTGGSGGEFDLWRNEAADGRATVSWLREQPWFTGILGTVGPSYLGYVQWALALDPPPELKAMVIQVGLHDPYALFYTGGALRLENALTRRRRHDVPAPGDGTRSCGRRCACSADCGAIITALPLREAYVPALGARVPWLDGVMTHPDADDPYWHGRVLAEAAERLSVPTSLITGWHDVLADQTLQQYARLRRVRMPDRPARRPLDTHLRAPAGLARGLRREPRLAAGPPVRRPLRTAPHSRARPRRAARAAWRDLDDWPPARRPPPRWFPAADGHPHPAAPAESTPLTSFRYDPADPTPSLGGPCSPGPPGPATTAL